MTSSPSWLDLRLSVEDRVDALLVAMTLDEKVGQLHQSPNVDVTDAVDVAALAAGSIGSTLLASGATAGNERDAGVTRERVDLLQRAAMRSRLGIPLLVARDVIHGHRTVFPIPLGLAASFDESMAEQIGARAAAEAIADGITWAFAPMIDVVDDARWGRVAESFGESPLVASRLGAAVVRGMQSSGSLTACAKHFVGYGLSRGGRDYASVDVGERMLRNTHLLPFRAAVEAGIGTIMAAFSDVDGVPMHSHRDLIRGVLKGEWGFDGVVVADWNGVGELVEHGVAKDLRQAARLAIEAGVDVDMVSGAYATHLAELVRAGDVDESLVDDATRRVLRLKIRLGLFDEGCPALTGGHSAEDGHALGLDHELAQRAAASALVTLKHDGGPALSATEGRILITGPYVHERASWLGTWVLDGDPTAVTTNAEEFASRMAANGDTSRLMIDDGLFADRSLRWARESDTTVAFVGEHAIRSGEDSAVTDLGLPPGQLDVLRALRRESQRLIVIVATGRPLALEAVAELADVLVLAFHPGAGSAGALADVLVGGASALGRLPMSFPYSAAQTPISHRERPSGRPLPAERSRYQDSPDAPFLRFGAGASGVTYGDLEASATVARDGGVLHVTLDVINRSEQTQREPVLLFMRDAVADITRPLRELIDLQVVEVAAHSALPVRFTVPVEAFGYVGRDGSFRIDTGQIELIAGWGRADESRYVVEVVE